MNKKERNRIIINTLAIVTILVAFLIINIRISQEQKQRFTLLSDDGKYCYGIDYLNREEDSLILKGWFLELKSIQKVAQTVSREDAERLIALIPVEKAIVGTVVEGAVVMDVETTCEDRPDVNEYFSCEYDYSKCGFTATVNCDDIDLQSNSYRVAVKLDADISSAAVLTNIYINDNGISYTDPRQSPKLDTEGTDLDKIVKEGVRLVSRPDVGCYVYQFDDKLYWIADEGFEFCEDGLTYIQYQMDTTQIDKLPAERLENNWFWSNIGGYFEQYEITDQINCGKYRVLMRDIPRDYSVTSVTTGYHDGVDWIWQQLFRLNFYMLF